MEELPRQTALQNQAPLRLPANRAAGTLQICVFVPTGLFLAWIALLVLTSLRFEPTRVSNRLVEYSLAVVMIFALVAGVLMMLAGLRWLLYACWPRPMGLIIGPEELYLRLGPFGNRRFDIDRLSAVYRFELREQGALPVEDDHLLPEEEQRLQIPLVSHPEHPQPLNRLLGRFICGSEQQQLPLLRPLIQRIRRS